MVCLTLLQQVNELDNYPWPYSTPCCVAWASGKQKFSLQQSQSSRTMVPLGVNPFVSMCQGMTSKLAQKKHLSHLTFIWYFHQKSKLQGQQRSSKTNKQNSNQLPSPSPQNNHLSLIARSVQVRLYLFSNSCCEVSISEPRNTTDHCFSNLNVPSDHLEILLKCKFLSNGSGRNQRSRRLLEAPRGCCCPGPWVDLGEWGRGSLIL